MQTPQPADSKTNTAADELGVVARTVIRVAESPYLPWTSSALSALAWPMSLARAPGLPVPLACFFFAPAFYVAGSALQQGHKDNGTGISVSMSTLWMMFGAPKAISAIVRKTNDANAMDTAASARRQPGQIYRQVSLAEVLGRSRAGKVLPAMLLASVTATLACSAYRYFGHPSQPSANNS